MKQMFAGMLIAALSLPGAFGHIVSEVDASKPAAFDIVSAGATTDGRLMTFMMEVAGQAGSVKPVAIGQLAGAKVESYVWPTSLDPAGSGSMRVRASCRSRSPPTPTSTTPHCTTKTGTAILPMTAPSFIG